MAYCPSAVFEVIQLARNKMLNKTLFSSLKHYRLIRVIYVYFQYGLLPRMQCFYVAVACTPMCLYWLSCAGQGIRKQREMELLWNTPGVWGTHSLQLECCWRVWDTVASIGCMASFLRIPLYAVIHGGRNALNGLSLVLALKGFFFFFGHSWTSCKQTGAQ